MNLTDLLASKKIVVLLGAGGVGKTTTSIATALLAAQNGRRVALLSIDPAKRLAAALGIPLGNQLRRIEFPPELGVKGTVDAAMLDQKAVFDGMVRRYSPSDDVYNRILAHPVYRAASTNLSGPLEYMALAKLQELAEDHRYDIVVLDTPPDSHALDFLERPNVLAGFMENRVMSWMIKPFLFTGKLGLGKLLNAGEKLMGGVAKVTGVSALRTFGEFLVLMQEVIEGFHASGEKIVGLLRLPSTSFFLVTVPTPAATRSARNIAKALAALRYRSDALIINRCLPEDVVKALEPTDVPALVALERRRQGEKRMMSGLQDDLTKDMLRPALYKLDDQERDLNDLAALLALAGALGRSGYSS